MSLLVPAGLIALLLLPVVFLLHLRWTHYRDHAVSSTLLWERVLAEAPRLRPWRPPMRLVLLALQLLALACGALALARPALVAVGPQYHLVVAVDTSLAMSATDVQPTRLARAQSLVGGLIDGLWPGDTMTLVDAGTSPRVLASSSDRSALRRVLAQLSTGSGPSSLAEDGPLLAGLQATGGPRTTVHLVVPLGASPQALDLLRRAVPGIRLQTVGADAADRGVAGLTISCPEEAGGRPCEAVARLINSGARPVATRVTALVDGAPSAEAITLPAGSSTPLRLALPATARTLEVRLDGHDALPADDDAWAVVPAPVQRTVLLVTSMPASPVAQALRAIPNLRLRVLAPRDPAVDQRARQSDVTVIEGGSAGGIPGNLLLIDPADGGALLGKLATARAPAVTTIYTTSPLVRNVDLSSWVLYTASVAHLPAWAHADIASAARGPLLLDGIAGGRRIAALLVDPQAHAGPGGVRTGSNLSTLLAFPTLLQNAVQALAPAASPVAPAGEVSSEPLTHQTATWLHDASRHVVALPLAGDLTALPALQPGSYLLSGGASGPVAVSVPVPQDPLSQSPPAPVVPSGGAASTAPSAAMPWELWAPAVLLVLLVLSAEWWYYTRRT